MAITLELKFDIILQCIFAMLIIRMADFLVSYSFNRLLGRFKGTTITDPSSGDSGNSLTEQVSRFNTGDLRMINKPPNFDSWTDIEKARFTLLYIVDVTFVNLFDFFNKYVFKN
jgi:hypothetical protein